MRFIGDFHIHSHYSRATSPEMNIVSLTKWSQIKGTHVVGTGDFTHPQWLSELKNRLDPAEPGLFRLKGEYEKDIESAVPESCRSPMRFILTVEISTIYHKKDKTRKIHSIIFSPSFEIVEKINKRLSVIGNLSADGRPILGLDAKELLSIVLDVSDGEAFLVPAHAWTPHFSVFGSESGFDSLEECFEELTPHIFSIETGLSSDPAMNWRIKKLDSIALMSNSDAHSHEKLGREANVFNCGLSYYAIRDALKNNDMSTFESTIEFFPEEGKYHLDGHRDCNVSLFPKETIERNFLCPACERPVTVGVLHRVEALADREKGSKSSRTRPFQSIIPLLEIIAELEGFGVASKKVHSTYEEVIRRFGNEFTVLLHTPLTELALYSPRLSEAIQRMREGRISIIPGYDGKYGTIKIFKDELKKEIPQESLF